MASKVKGPGRRSGEGSESIVPYLHEELATKPQDLEPDPPKPRKSLTSRVRRALSKLRK
ncbi:MAG TPA: hypothetical protein VLI46_08360 [Ramlibacter sp.]|nr:hypothetical protein [Ramlibacter sp.]